MPFKTIDLTLPENFAPFDGDGRKKVGPNSTYRSLRPEVDSISVTRGVARTLIQDFMEKGFSNHSAKGHTLWIIETWCYAQDIDVKITKHPFGGWQVRQLEQEVEEEPALETPEQTSWEEMLARSWM